VVSGVIAGGGGDGGGGGDNDDDDAADVRLLSCDHIPIPLGVPQAAGGGGVEGGEMSLEKRLLAEEAMRQIEHALRYDAADPSSADPTSALLADGGDDSLPFLALCDSDFLATHM